MTNARLVEPSTEVRRAEFLARAPADAIGSVADRCLELLGAPRVMIEPEVGVVVLQVREPVVGDRFQLGEAVAVRAEVVVGAHSGWCMRLGTDRVAALSGAICDAAAQAGGEAARLVDDFVEEVEAHLRHESARRAERLAATVVEFEELD